MEKKILSVGLAVCDIAVAPVPDTLFTFDSIEVDKVQVHSGGDALNVAVNLSKLGVQVEVICRIGNDMFGDLLIKNAINKKVDTKYMKRTSDGTAVAIVIIDGNGERHFIYYGGGNNHFQASDVTDEMLEQAGFLYIGSMFGLPKLTEGLPSLLMRAKEKGLQTAVDLTGNPTHEHLPALEAVLPYIDYFMPSMEEATGLTGLSDPVLIINKFLSHNCKCVIIKNGAKGVWLATPEKTEQINAFQVQQVDATGAGDAFVSGFLFGLQKNMDLSNCARLGCATGAICVGSIGATSATPTAEELKNFLEKEGLKII